MDSVGRVCHLPILRIVGDCINLQVLWVLYSITDKSQFRRPPIAPRDEQHHQAGRLHVTHLSHAGTIAVSVMPLSSSPPLQNA